MNAGAERSDLRTHAGVDNELAATTFGDGNVLVQCKMFVGSSDVRTAFDVAQPRVVEKILSAMGVHGLTVAAIMEEMTDIKGSHNWRTVSLSFGARDAQDSGVWKLSSVGERSSSAFWVVWRSFGERRLEACSLEEGETRTDVFPAWFGQIFFAFVESHISML